MMSMPPQAKHKTSHARPSEVGPPAHPSDADLRCYSDRFYLHSLDDRIEDYKPRKKRKKKLLETLLIALYA